MLTTRHGVAWDPAGYRMEHRPLVLAERVPCPAITGAFGWLDMLIKIPFGEARLPSGMPPGIRSLVENCLFADSDTDARYAYLTIDRRIVAPGRTHRNAGWHFDGMQGARYSTKLPACRQYVVTWEGAPTEFCSGPFDLVRLNEREHNWFTALLTQPVGEVFTYAPGTVIAMTAYQTHRSPVATARGWRTFFRLDLSYKRQDRLGNTMNPALPAPWTLVPRTLPAHLITPINDTGWSG